MLPNDENDSIFTPLHSQYSGLPQRVSRYTGTQWKREQGRKLGLGFCTKCVFMDTTNKRLPVVGLMTLMTTFMCATIIHTIANVNRILFHILSEFHTSYSKPTKANAIKSGEGMFTTGCSDKIHHDLAGEQICSPMAAVAWQVSARGGPGTFLY